MNRALPLYEFFEELRKQKKGLGADDYFTLLEVLMHEVAEGQLIFIRDKQAVLRLCKLLWFKPTDNKVLFEEIFEKHWREVIFKKEDFEPSEEAAVPPDSTKQTLKDLNKQDPLPVKDKDTQTPYPSKQDMPTPNPSKVYLNINEFAGQQDYSTEGSRKSFYFVDKYVPFQRRNIGQVWRFLQKNQSVFISDEINIEETIRHILKTGVLQKIQYKRYQRNDLVMLTLIEHRGGMTAFKNLANELAQSAKASAGINNKIFFFQTIPHRIHLQNQSGYCVYTDETRTKFEILENVLAKTGRNTPVLIISDAGAVANYLDYDRIKKTYQFLATLEQHTQKVVWLNPMPEDRRTFNSAEHIEQKVAMFEADLNGLRKVIKFLRSTKQTLR